MDQKKMKEMIQVEEVMELVNPLLILNVHEE
jgi:hypothetical protein